jgi:molybdopterin converting factor small subunit
MKINVKFLGLLKLEGIKSGSDIEISDGTTVSEFMNRYVAKKEHHRFIIVMTNEKKVDLSYELKQNDAVSLFLPFGAG